jgi:hypothetical protein
MKCVCVCVCGNETLTMVKHFADTLHMSKLCGCGDTKCYNILASFASL